LAQARQCDLAHCVQVTSVLEMATLGYVAAGAATAGVVMKSINLVAQAFGTSHSDGCNNPCASDSEAKELLAPKSS